MNGWFPRLVLVCLLIDPHDVPTWILQLVEKHPRVGPEVFHVHQIIPPVLQKVVLSPIVDNFTTRLVRQRSFIGVFVLD